MDQIVVIIGSKDKELINQIQAQFQMVGSKRINFVKLDNEAYQNSIDFVKRQVIKWEEKQSISEYIKDPDNIKNALEKVKELDNLIFSHLAQQAAEEFDRKANIVLTDAQGKVVEREVREEFEWNGYFTKSQAVKASGNTYKEIEALLDAFYAFGFLAIRSDGEGGKMYRLLPNDQATLDYLEEVKAEYDHELKKLNAMIKPIKGRLTSAKKKAAKAKKE